MSDIRTKILLGTTLGAFAMIFVMAAGVDAFNTNTSVASNGYTVNAHVTMMAVHPDGSVSYSQGDNLSQDLGKDVALKALFDESSQSLTVFFDCIRIGDEGTPTLTGPAVNPMNAAATAAAACDADGTLGNIELSSAGTVGEASGDLVASFTMLAGDLTDGSVTITEASLENAGAVVISHVALGTAVTANLDTVVTVTYTMSLT